MDEIQDDAELRLGVRGGSAAVTFSLLVLLNSPGSLEGCDGGGESMPCGGVVGTTGYDSSLASGVLLASLISLCIGVDGCC
jgi:hypothetical protein